MQGLTDTNALVTGAGSGIGRAVAATLARRGASVWLADLDLEATQESVRAIAEEGGEAKALHMDVTDAASLGSRADEVFAADGRLDLLVANAGVSTMNPFFELSEEEWDFNFSVNAKGTFLTIQTFARRMAQQDPRAGSELRGKLVATASMAARQAAPLLAHYSASKFAVVGLIQSAAKELAAHKLTLNGVNPGLVKTSMQDREVGWEAELRGISREQVIQDYIEMTPLGRLQTPEDVAKVVAFLAGPDSDFLTGEVIEVNGGAYMT